ncbi:MAG: hypothetical protein JWN46_3763 [Acidimicrobiales bacterium]|nr:hypothetical protein [Acidimicrobiales bacterium]
MGSLQSPVRRPHRPRLAVAATAALAVLSACASSSPGVQSTTSARRPSPKPSTTAPQAAPVTIRTVAGMPPVHDPVNLYRDAGAGMLSPATSAALPRVYVPNGASGTVTVIDPASKQVVGTFPAGKMPQHVVPAYDLQRLWVLENSSNALLPIDPKTALPGPSIPVDDPYNLYFTPDGREAMVVAEQRQRLDFRDPQTMALHSSLPLPCPGLNHMDFSIDGRYLIATCEFGGRLVKVDLTNRTLAGVLPLGPSTSMPQDVRISPDGKRFYVADMMVGGVWIVDGDAFKVIGFVVTGVGAHGLYPSRDGRSLYVANRGWSMVRGGRHGPGNVSVIDFATSKVSATWPIPGGGSPDMGNITADGRELWLAGRYDSEVYVFDTTTGGLAARIPVGDGPHGLTVWPQPGRYSLGHTGNMR